MHRRGDASKRDGEKGSEVPVDCSLSSTLKSARSDVWAQAFKVILLPVELTVRPSRRDCTRQIGWCADHSRHHVHAAGHGPTQGSSNEHAAARGCAGFSYVFRCGDGDFTEAFDSVDPTISAAQLPAACWASRILAPLHRLGIGHWTRMRATSHLPSIRSERVQIPKPPSSGSHPMLQCAFLPMHRCARLAPRQLYDSKMSRAEQAARSHCLHRRLCEPSCSYTLVGSRPPEHQQERSGLKSEGKVIASVAWLRG